MRWQTSGGYTVHSHTHTERCVDKALPRLWSLELFHSKVFYIHSPAFVKLPSWKKRKHPVYLGGAFKYFSCSSLFGEMILFDSYVSTGVETTNQLCICSKRPVPLWPAPQEWCFAFCPQRYWHAHPSRVEMWANNRWCNRHGTVEDTPGCPRKLGSMVSKWVITPIYPTYK